MNIEAFFLCDAATDSHGKLNVLGVFDSIVVASVPATHAQCAVVLRLRLTRSEQGEHKLSLRLVDADGQNVIQPLEGGFRFAAGQDTSAATNLILNVQGLRLPRFGELAFQLHVDGTHLASLPVHVRQLPGAAPRPAPAN